MMMLGPEGPSTAGSAHGLSDDTVEPELAGEHALALSRAPRATAPSNQSGPFWPCLRTRILSCDARRESTSCVT